MGEKTTKDIVIGSVVRLKSGGPNMTIEDVKESGLSFRCVWFDKNHHSMGGIFRAVALEAV